LNIEQVIDWRGFCQPIDPELDAMDLLVFPSILAEGMPMVLLEAMASGLPIVATRVAGTTDVIEHGRTGLLVEPNEPAALADAISTVLNSPTLWEQLSENGRQSHAQNYSDKVMAERMAKLYRTALAQAKK
jgi:glycosyltransferase involved in cell wall biosynthesis